MNPKTKKAQGLSIQTIIIAVLALAVLVVLILIFMGVVGPTGIFFGEQLTCEARGGKCGELKSTCETNNGLFTTTLKCGNTEIKHEKDKGCCIEKKEKK